MKTIVLKEKDIPILKKILTYSIAYTDLHRLPSKAIDRLIKQIKEQIQQ